MLERRLLPRLNHKKGELDLLRPLPEAPVRRLQEQLTVEWIYNSNAIEGSTLTLRETQLILETGLTIGGKSLREHFEVINHKDAIEYVERLSEQDAPLSAFHVRQIHKLVLSRIDDDNAGQYRRTQVRIDRAQHVPPESWEVPQRMQDWETWLHQAETELHPVVLAAQAHHRLVAIHPFVDGNGRTARLVMNLVLSTIQGAPVYVRMVTFTPAAFAVPPNVDPAGLHCQAALFLSKNGGMTYTRIVETGWTPPNIAPVHITLPVPIVFQPGTTFAAKVRLWMENGPSDAGCQVRVLAFATQP